jgi:hypothetical protein
MRKPCLLFFFFAIPAFLNQLTAQQIITVNAGTDLYISPGTAFTVDALTLTPSAGFTLNGIQLTKAANVTTFTQNSYVNLVYKFSTGTAPFSGTLLFRYQDGNLNGLTEGNLRVNISNGSSWTAVAGATNDVVNNTVLSTAVSAAVMSEVALADASQALPLHWGPLTVARAGRVANLQWTTFSEMNLSHFTVERSLDGRAWETVISSVPAMNTMGSHRYTETDRTYIAAAVWYRIRQTDRDGRFTYSPTVMLQPDGAKPVLSVFPNPVRSGFFISTGNGTAIRQVVLYNGAGQAVKSWENQPAQYSMEGLPPGLYHLSIQLQNGTRQQYQLNKQ